MPKLLADFLQEQQEPFALEVYLVERGYPKQYNSTKHAIPNCSDFVRAVFSQFVEANGRRKKGENAGEDGFSSASSSESDVGVSHCSEAAIRRFVKCGNCFFEGEGEGEGEVEVDKKSKLRGEEDSKQLSPISVLGETELDHQDSPTHFKRGGESSSSRSYDQFLINKTTLQQRKQLLIDCTREVIEKCRKKDKINSEEMKNVLGGEEIWKYVWMWSQDSIRKSNIVHLLHSDFLASIEEWHLDFEQQKYEISMEIEKDILENVINEIIASMVA